MSKSSSPLKLGKETYGVLKIEEVFVKALKYYFRNEKSNVKEYVKKNKFKPFIK